MNRTRLAAVVVLGLLFGTSPALAQDREQLQMLAELRMIQEQSGQLRALMATIEETLKALNAKIDQQADATRRGFADQKLQIDSLRDNVGVLREKVDDTNVRISTLSQEMQTLRATVATIQQAPAPAAPATETGAQPVSPPVTAAQPPAPDAARTFNLAMADYFAPQYDLAISGFESYLRTYPNGPEAAKAQYYIGESHFNMSRFEDAVTAYGRVISTYKTGDWVAEAYYKQGLSYERLKQIDAARRAYETVIKNFPDSNAALLAKPRLQALPR